MTAPMKSLAARINERWGEENDPIVVEALYLIGFGTAAERRKFFGKAVPVSTALRLLAIVTLRDLGPGRPAVAVELDARVTRARASDGRTSSSASRTSTTREPKNV